MAIDGLVENAHFRMRKQAVDSLLHDNASSEVKDYYEKDINSLFGKALDKALDLARYKKRKPDHYVYIDLPKHLIAANLISSDGTIAIAYNKMYAGKLRNNRRLRLYVNLHQHTHIRGESDEGTVDNWVMKAMSLE